MSDILATGFKAEPFWWERAPRPDLSGNDLPAKADVVIVGSGYTGLSAAIQCARGGRETVVIDAETPGWGCSSRNGGQISTSIKPGYDWLTKRYGHETAMGILREGHNALAWIADFISDEGIDCDFTVCGRLYAAHTAAKFREISESRVKPVEGLETGAYVVPREELASEIGSPLYHGGVVLPRHASLDPGRYHLGLLRVAQEAGVTVVPNCRADRIGGSPGALRLATSRGEILARNIIVATSGYTGNLTPWQKRRIIPIGSYIIATEPLEPARARALIPKNRVVTDTRRLVVYYRLDPSGTRMVFGGRVSIAETDAEKAAPALHAEMCARFPDLTDVRVSHAWMGFVGYTFDELPHLGERDGVHYSMGYCGSGVSLASYFGMRIGQQVLGQPQGASPLTRTAFESRPYYWGRPWFLSPALQYYKWQDARGA